MNLNNDWSLVFHQVTPHSIEIWVGVLHSHVLKPNAELIVRTNDGAIVQTHHISKQQWQRPYSQVNTRFYHFMTLQGLAPNTRYDVQLNNSDINQTDFSAIDGQLKTLAQGSAHTLALDLDSYDNGFTISLGSCFFDDKDNSSVSHSFDTLYNGPRAELAPHISFLTGDQVYLDIGFDSLNPIKRDIRERIAGDYAKHWHALRGIFRHGGNWFLADDHEFWNGYPDIGSSPFLQSLRMPHVKSTWKRVATDAVENIQRITPVRTFTLGNDLAFCVADLRTYRSKTRFIKEENFKQIIHWINNLTSPGVLVIPQPLIVKESSGESNLATFKSQYRQLLLAIANADHDVLVLSGDIHHGRVCSVPIGEHGRTLYEVAASPMSNLTGISSIAASYGKARTRPKNFPMMSINGLKTKTIHYGKQWTVPSAPKSRLLDFTYLERRTKEHFMTLNFKRTNDGIEVTTQAWLVRHKDRQHYPKTAWPKPITFTLT